MRGVATPIGLRRVVVSIDDSLCDKRVSMRRVGFVVVATMQNSTHNVVNSATDAIHRVTNVHVWPATIVVLVAVHHAHLELNAVQTDALDPHPTIVAEQSTVVAQSVVLGVRILVVVSCVVVANLVYPPQGPHIVVAKIHVPQCIVVLQSVVLHEIHLVIE